MNVLVTDGENRSALAVTRSLGRRGCRVFITAKAVRNIAACSKYCVKGYSVADPMQNGIEFVTQITEVVNREEIDIIFPVTEASIYQLNRYREFLPKSIILACQQEDKMAAVSNKFRLFQLAEELRVPIPSTIYVEGEKDLAEKERFIVNYPVVVKPGLSKIPNGMGFISSDVTYAHSREELKEIFRARDVLRHPSLIQERIEGPGTGLFTLFDGDRHLALFSHRRLLEKPPSGGVSVLSESVLLDEGMVEAARRLLSHVGWTGIAMVEFKRDKKDGKAKLMEINGRFWGSLQLAVASGVDFPSLCLDYYLCEKPLNTHLDYRVGHRLKWVFGVIDHLIIRLKKSENSLNLPTDALSLWKVFVELLKVGDTNTSSDVFNSKDLKPFLRESKEYIHNILRGSI